MALSRIQSVFTFSSASGGQEYVFDAVMDAHSQVSIRNIRGPHGLIRDAQTGIPEAVLEDMREAKNTVLMLLSESTADSGVVVFEGDVSKDVLIAEGVLNTAEYRVLYTTSDGVVLRTSGKTLTGFTVDAGSAYGTPESPKTVTYTVLVSTTAVSAFSGVVTIAAADGGSKTVAFPSTQPTAAYRVVLEERGFFQARVVSQTRSGFTVQLGHTLGAGQSVEVGYDVFV